MYLLLELAALLENMIASVFPPWMQYIRTYCIVELVRSMKGMFFIHFSSNLAGLKSRKVLLKK